ncbi:MAG: glycosyltransferase family 4 protein, partial [candidate division WOR-3 bacterium]
MKICMVSDIYLPNPSGIGEHIYHLSRELRQRGHRVIVLTSSGEEGRGEASPVASEDEAFVYRVGRAVTIPANRSLSRITVGVGLDRQIRSLFASERFDIVHIHGSLAPTLPLVALRQSRSINFATFHAAHGRNPGYRLFRGYLNSYFRKLHCLIAVSEAARRTMQRYFPGEYRIIPNGIDTGVFAPEARPLPQFLQRRPRILFLGRFDPRKGLTYLLRAFPQVRRAVPGVQCIIVGSGPLGVERYRAMLPSEAIPDVIFVGTIPGSERVRYYASCDVFCAPSTGNESFGIVLLEAMATGKPVVASDIDGYREVLTHNVEGLLVPPKSPTALAAALVDLLRHPARARQMGEAGRNKALRYAWP